MSGDDDLWQEFAAESEEHLDRIEWILAEGAANRAAVDTLFRAFHSLKGMSGALGAGGMLAVAHRCEDILGLARQGRIAVAGDVAHTLVAAVDRLRHQRAALLEGGADPPAPAGLLARLGALAEGRVVPMGTTDTSRSDVAILADVLQKAAAGLAALAAGPDEAAAGLARELGALARRSKAGRLAQLIEALTATPGPEALPLFGDLCRRLEAVAAIAREEAGAVPLRHAIAARVGDAGMPARLHDVAARIEAGAAAEADATARAAGQAAAIAAALGLAAAETLLLTVADLWDRPHEPEAVAAVELQRAHLAGRLRAMAAGGMTAMAAPEDATQAATDAEPLRAAAGEAGATLRVRREAIDGIIALEAEVRAAGLAVAEAAAQESARRLPGAIAALADGMPTASGREVVAASERVRHVLLQVQQAGSRLSLSLRRLDEAMIELRVMPLAGLFGRMPRVARAVAEASGKDVEVELAGGEVSIDRSLIELLADPLMHLVRNAVDHGVETPAARTARGKPARAVVRIAATRRGADRVCIAVADDGGGIDRESVLRTALAHGLVTQLQAGALDEAGVHALLFRPGFSTRNEASAISGRGVGLDVVEEAVHRAGGRLTVSSRPEVGTEFLLDLPLSAAMAPVLLVDVGGHAYALPAARIEAVLHADDRAQAARLPGIVSLEAALGFPPPEDPPSIVVVSGPGGRPLGLSVGRVSRRTDLLLQPLHPALAALPGIGGVGVLGTGEPVIVLEPDGFVPY